MNKTKLGKGIYRRGNVFWYATKMTDGKRRLVSLQTQDEKEAIERAAILKHDQKFKIEVKANTISDDIERYLNAKKLTAEHSRRSTEWSKGALKQFAAFVKEKKVDDVTSDDVKGFCASLRKRVKQNGELMSENSVHAYFRALRGFFTWTVKTAKLRFDNPCKEVKLGKAAQPARLRFATADQRDALISNASQDMKFVLYCIFHAGMRKDEVIQARPDWFNLEDGYVYIHKTATFTPKNRKNRYVPLTDPFKAFLQEYGLSAPFVLRPDVVQGEADYRWDFRRPWSDLLKATTKKLNAEAIKTGKSANHDLSWITPHLGRHSFASLHVQRGTSVYKVAEWIGDDIKTTTKHYAHLAKSDDTINNIL